MKALTLKSPFAGLMLCGKIETRTWATNYRGEVLICEGLQPYGDADFIKIAGDEQAERAGFEFVINPRWTSAPGHAIAVGTLVDCRPMKPEDTDACFVQFREGLFCHIYENVRRIAPFKFKGGQRWKNLTETEISQIKYLD